MGVPDSSYHSAFYHKQPLNSHTENKKESYQASQGSAQYSSPYSINDRNIELPFKLVKDSNKDHRHGFSSQQSNDKIGQFDQSRNLDTPYMTVNHNLVPQRQVIQTVFEPTVKIDDASNRITSPISPNKKRSRPGPIVIPPVLTNRPNFSGPSSPTRTFQNLAKAVYTPPAMLSPQSIFFNPHATPKSIVTPTPARYLLSARRSSKFKLSVFIFISQFLLLLFFYYYFYLLIKSFVLGQFLFE